MRIAVIIASKGRPAELSNWIYTFQAQSLQPWKVIYSVSSSIDLPDKAMLYPGATILYGQAGLAAQRNRGLDSLTDNCELVAFFDDDYVAESKTLEDISYFFRDNPLIVGANGHLLADGINTAGISYPEAVDIIRKVGNRPDKHLGPIQDLAGLYGCNMVFRRSAIIGLRFDENLPLYGWQEDFDFAARVSKRGRIVGTTAFSGVHQGVKSGRTSGQKLGYSQVANPVYLVKKRSMSKTYAFRLVVKNILSNHFKFFFPEPWIDRKGRVIGNWLALRDLCLWRLDPRKILDWN